MPIRFKYIGFGLYSVVKDSFIFRPEAFKMLSDDRYSYNRLFYNVWIKR